MSEPMSPLDAAKAMARNPCVPIAGSQAVFSCWYCRLVSQDEVHTPDCPVRHMPQIVAALEDAEMYRRKYWDLRSEMKARGALPLDPH